MGSPKLRIKLRSKPRSLLSQFPTQFTTQLRTWFTTQFTTSEFSIGNKMKVIRFEKLENILVTCSLYDCKNPRQMLGKLMVYLQGRQLYFQPRILEAWHSNLMRGRTLHQYGTYRLVYNPKHLKMQILNHLNYLQGEVHFFSDDTDYMAVSYMVRYHFLENYQSQHYEIFTGYLKKICLFEMFTFFSSKSYTFLLLIQANKTQSLNIVVFKYCVTLIKRLVSYEFFKKSIFHKHHFWRKTMLIKRLEK